MLPTSDEMDRYKALSLELYEVLDDVGLSDVMRSTKAELSSTREVLETLLVPPQHAVYFFGSQPECSTIPQMNSDLDMMDIPTNIRIVTNITECLTSDGFLLVPDRQPGYARLQLVTQGRLRDRFNFTPMDMLFTPLNSLVLPYLTFKDDKFSRICLSRDFYQAQGLKVDTHRQGPAINYHGTEHMTSRDFIVALKCESWPEIAAEWLTRKREHGWPSPELIDRCKSMGFLVVAVGHPDSDEQEIQWRISFSHQELLFVTQFNSVQLKCYFLMKLIKKELIQQSIKEETLTSYHCKTCMFYCMENTPCELWVPENLLCCLIMCLRQLVSWVGANNCPNYFIPGENMFDRIRNNDLKKKLQISLCFILIFYDLKNLLKRIESDENIKFLKRFNPADKPFLKQCLMRDINGCALIYNLFGVMLIRNRMLSECFDRKLEICMNKLDSKITELEETKCVTDHTEAETKEAISLILPFLQLSRLTLKVVERAGKRKEKLQEILNDEKWTELDFANGSSKLKQSCVMFMLGYTEKSRDISLSIIEKGVQSEKRPLCGCYVHLTNPDTTAVLNVPVQRPNIMIKKLLREVYQPCVVFLPNESSITPIAINYEMIRCLRKPSRIVQNILLEVWCDWGIVEGLFLTQFLSYMNQAALGQKSDASEAIGGMIRIVNKRIPCHLDTSLNLLGWVYKDRGDVDSAVDCFIKSMTIQPTYNAAFWHLCFLICGY